MAGARQELLSDMWLYKAGEGLSSAFPGLVLVSTIGAKDILFLMITINIAFLQFPFPLFSEKINNCPIYFKNM
jgi:hypothetical protein